MGIGDKLLDRSYRPDIIDIYTPNTFNTYNKVIKFNGRFTLDPLEYMESKEFLGYKLRPIQKNMVIDLFDVDETGLPKNDVLVAIIGMRSGKSAVGSMIMSFLLHRLLAYDDPAKELGQLPHYKLTGIFVANSAEQAQKTCYSSFRSLITEAPWWVSYLKYLQDREVNEGKETLFQMYQQKIYFPEKNLDAISITSNSASAAGSTAWGIVFEELARADLATGVTQDTTEKRSAQAVYDTISRAAKTLYPFSKICITSSPLFQTDFSMQLLYQSKVFRCGENQFAMDSLRAKYFPVKVDRMVAYNYTSWEANPRTEGNPTGFTRASFDPEFARNPTSAARDFGSLPPGSLNPFFEYPEKIDNCIDMNKEIIVLFENKIIEQITNGPNGSELRKYIGKEAYPQQHDKLVKRFLAADPGEVKDNFVISMSHSEKFIMELPAADGRINKIEKYKIIVDFVAQWIPDKANRTSVSFQNIEEVIMLLAQYFNITTVLFDSWQSSEAIERLFRQGIHTDKIGATVEMYDTLKMLVYSDMVVFPNDNILVQELKQLNKVRSASGHERVDHPNNGCFSADTKIKLLDGTTPTIKELADKGVDNEFWVYSCLPDGTIVPAKAHNAHKTKEITKLCRVILDNNEVIECTSEHLFMLRNGEYKQAKDLGINESLMPLYYKYEPMHSSKGKYERLYFKKGWHFTHRLIFKFLNPKYKTGKGFVIHHNNCNSMDNTPENLTLLSERDHGLLHTRILSTTNTPKLNKQRSETLKEKYRTDPHFKDKCKISGEKLQLFWKSEEGKNLRQELSKTQLRAAYQVRLNRAEKRRQEVLQSEQFKYMLSYSQVRATFGGTYNIWRRWLDPQIFAKNARNMIGKSLDEILILTNRTHKKVLIKLLKELGVYDEISNFNHKVIKIEIINLNVPVSVYDITVPEYNNFALESGIFVHNSKDSADSIVRSVWAAYNESVKSATRGEFIMPIVQRFSTVRGAAQYFEEQKNNGSSDAIWGSGSSQGSPFGGNNDSLFGGSDTYIRGNVQGDFRKNK